MARTQTTQWNKEPWTQGAIATAAPGWQGARRTLMEPIRNRVFFAGEAVHETAWGTVGGAWESGTRAADAVVRRLAGPARSAAAEARAGAGGDDARRQRQAPAQASRSRQIQRAASRRVRNRSRSASADA